MQSLAFIAVAFGAILPASAQDDREKAAKEHYEMATAAYGLGNFDSAATHYEKAFELKADQALLYNAAQAHRLAKNTDRALTLYKNYVRLFPRAPRRNDAVHHIQKLEAEVTASKGAGGDSSPPPVTPPTTGYDGGPRPGGDVPVALRAEPSTTAAPVVLTATQPTPDEAQATPLYRRPWLWVTVGVVAAAVVGALVIANRQDRFPEPSWGTVTP